MLHHWLREIISIFYQEYSKNKNVVNHCSNGSVKP